MAREPECGGASGRGGETRLLLAQGGFTAVERCRCGAIYLTVGPVCLRLDPAALPELEEVIGQASAVLGLASVKLSSGNPPEPGEAAGGERSGERGEGASGGDPAVEHSPPTKLN